MHPTTLILSLAALTSVAVSSKHEDHGPRCPEDEYYNTMMESKNRKAAATDCAKWLSGTITDPKEIPKYLDDCGTDKNEDRVNRVSAACSCVATSSVSTTLTSSTHISSTPSSTATLASFSNAVTLPGSTSLPHAPTPSSSLHSPTTSSSHEPHPTASSSPAHNHETMSASSTEALNTVSSSMHATMVITNPDHPTSTLPLHFATTQPSSEVMTDSSHAPPTPGPNQPAGSADTTSTGVTPTPASTTSFTTSTICKFVQPAEQNKGAGELTFP